MKNAVTSGLVSRGWGASMYHGTGLPSQGCEMFLLACPSPKQKPSRAERALSCRQNFLGQWPRKQGHCTHSCRRPGPLGTSHLHAVLLEGAPPCCRIDEISLEALVHRLPIQYVLEETNIMGRALPPSVGLQTHTHAHWKG